MSAVRRAAFATQDLKSQLPFELPSVEQGTKWSSAMESLHVKVESIQQTLLHLSQLVDGSYKVNPAEAVLSYLNPDAATFVPSRSGGCDFESSISGMRSTSDTAPEAKSEMNDFSGFASYFDRLQASMSDEHFSREFVQLVGAWEDLETDLEVPPAGKLTDASVQSEWIPEVSPTEEIAAKLDEARCAQVKSDQSHVSGLFADFCACCECPLPQRTGDPLDPGADLCDSCYESCYNVSDDGDGV